MASRQNNRQMIGSGHVTAAERDWIPAPARDRERSILEETRAEDASSLTRRIELLIGRNRTIHEVECINLNPATNVMNPRAEAALASGLGTRASLGYPGQKYEMGVEAIEEIEVIAAELACRVFGARYSEVRVGSGAFANLYAFIATCRPGDSIIVPPASVGGHVTHNQAGAAGLFGLDIHEFPVDGASYTVDLEGLAALAHRVHPKLITIGGSLNLVPHPVAEIRAIADEVGARVLFDAAHVCGLFAGGVWPNPLDEGADLMTMSTYKSLGGPAGGLVVTNEVTLAARIDAIAYPGLTANFDAGRTAALAIALLDWLYEGDQYARAMTATADALAKALAERGLPMFRTSLGYTTSHQLAVVAECWGGGHAGAVRLREANILTSAIGLPGHAGMAGLRLGTPEAVRWGMTEPDMDQLADLIRDALSGDPLTVAPRTTDFRGQFTRLHYIHD